MKSTKHVDQPKEQTFSMKFNPASKMLWVYLIIFDNF